MGHGHAESMVDHFNSCIEGLTKKHILQISMDGPNVNHKFRRIINDSISTDYNHSLLDIGSCGLHVVHGAFKDGAVASGWLIQKLLLGLYHLFKDSPARREDYKKTTGSEVLPLKFCCHRWLENVPVAERAVEIWPNILKYVKAITARTFTRPTCASYDSVLDATKDPVILPKLLCFISVAKMMAPFLTQYQTNRPLIPFLAEDLYKMTKNLLHRFIRKEVMDGVTSIVKLLKVDIKDKDNYKSQKNIEVGFETEQKMKSAHVSEKHTMEIRMDCRNFLVAVVAKIIEKSPLKYSLSRHSTCLDPRLMVNSKDEALCRMKKMLAHLVEVGWVKSSSCDDILYQLGDFIDIIVQRNQTTFQSFEPHTEIQRLDELFFNYMGKDIRYAKLWTVVKQVLTLSHGQATVERGFSVNKEVVDDNQNNATVIAQRIICDHIEDMGGVLKVDINEQMLASAASARHRYTAYLEERRKSQENQKRGEKRKDILREIDDLKKKRIHLEKDITSMKNSADEFAVKAESTRNFSFIAKSNSLRTGAKQKEIELVKVTESLDNKVKTLKD